MTRGRWHGPLSVLALAVSACVPAPRPSTLPAAPAAIATSEPAVVATAAEPAPAAPVWVPPDRDGDGIVDRDDACPDVPGIAAKVPTTHGCPVGTTLRGCRTILEERLTFAPNSATLKGASAALAEKIGKMLVQHEELALVEIAGLAGPSERNRPLLRRQRANVVRDVIVAQGVSPARLRVVAGVDGRVGAPCWTCDCGDWAGGEVEATVLQRAPEPAPGD